MLGVVQSNSIEVFEVAKAQVAAASGEEFEISNPRPTVSNGCVIFERNLCVAV